MSQATKNGANFIGSVWTNNYLSNFATHEMARVFVIVDCYQPYTNDATVVYMCKMLVDYSEPHISILRHYSEKELIKYYKRIM